MRTLRILLVLSLLGLSTVGCTAMQSLVVLASEKPSMEVSLERLYEVEKAADVTKFYIKEAAIGKDSLYPAEIGKLPENYEKDYYDKLHCSGVYAMPKRFILPVRLYAQRLEELKVAITGEYPNFFEAFKALTGENGTKVRIAYESWMGNVTKIAENDGKVEGLKAVNKLKETKPEDKKTNSDEIVKINADTKIQKEQSKAKFKELLKEVELLGQDKSIVNTVDKMKLAINLQTVSTHVARVQDLASMSVFAALVQFGRAAPDAPTEMQELLKRLVKEGGDAANQVKQIFNNVKGIPRRIGALGSLLGQQSNFNRAMAKALKALTGVPVIEPNFNALSSEFKSVPAICTNPAPMPVQ